MPVCNLSDPLLDVSSDDSFKTHLPMSGTYPHPSDRPEPLLEKRRFALLVARWHDDLTELLFQGAYDVLLRLGCRQDNIVRQEIPGCYELPLAAQRMAARPEIDAVICLGCVIRGETPHFDYICKAVAEGLLQVSLASGKPVSFGVITALDRGQAWQRAGGKHGNKGEEAALAAAEMVG